jgi:replicative DNA helicase
MIEQAILSNLFANEAYARQVLPFIKDEYFHQKSDRHVFTLISTFFEKYNSLPTKAALKIEADKIDNVTDREVEEVVEAIDTLADDSKEEMHWLVENTEKFCQDKAVYNAIMQSIQILDDKSGKTTKGQIPELLTKALAVSFDASVGHDYLEDSDDRYTFYHTNEKRMPFDIDILNKACAGGVPAKTLNVILAGTNVGKSLALCHMASAHLLKGYNVLYITLEMAEEAISERIDANLLDVSTDELRLLSKEVYDKKIAKIKGKTTGKLVVKEFPTAGAHVGHFRHLLHELKIKKNFTPDVIYIDYINICLSSRIRLGGSVNTNTYIKSIAEELRGLAVEFKIPVWSATQTNRGGYSSTDLDLDDTGESFGLPQTVDFMMSLVSTEELEKLGQYMAKILKTRYNRKSNYRRFVIGVDYTRMRLYEVDQPTEGVMNEDGGDDDDVPAFDKTPFGKGAKRNLFEGFK